MTSGEQLQPVAVGLRLRQLRHARGKTLEVVAGLVGISAGYLSVLETGKRTLDRLLLILDLAEVLQTSPSELISLSAIGTGHQLPRLCTPSWVLAWMRSPGHNESPESFCAS
ncbi:MAG: helix-turn-helix domain-containing protein [Pseudonocardiales bacterium]